LPLLPEFNDVINKDINNRKEKAFLWNKDLLWQINSILDFSEGI